MASSLVINISGSLLASIFYEHVNSPSDQDGFLLGELMSHITDSISDSQMYSEKEENCINIHTFVPCSKLFSYYNNVGSIQLDKLNEILNGKKKDVIGWYKYRRNSTLSLSLRESVIHSNLAKIFASSTSKFFVFGLFTESLAANDSTYSFDHIFVRERNGNYEPISLNIVNLGDTSHSEYQTFSKSITNTQSGHYRNIINSIENRPHSGDDDPGVKKIENIHTALQDKLSEVQQEVAGSESIITKLSKEISDIKAKIHSLESQKSESGQQSLSASNSSSTTSANDENNSLKASVQDEP